MKLILRKLLSKWALNGAVTLLTLHGKVHTAYDNDRDSLNLYRCRLANLIRSVRDL